MITNDTSARSIQALIEAIFVETDPARVVVGDKAYESFTPAGSPGLVHWLYSVLHTGHLTTAPPAHNRDADYESRIRSLVDDPWMSASVEPQVGALPEGTVQLGRVRVLAPLDAHDDGRHTVRLPCFRPNLTPGFFMFVHDEGESRRQGPSLRRHYLGADDPDAALDLWAAAVTELAAANLAFRSKILSRRSSFPRNDALVFYSGSDTGRVEEQLIDIVRRRGVAESWSWSGTSLLCRPVIGPLHTASDPVRTGPAEQSYGEHRCAAIADAVNDVIAGRGTFVETLETRLRSAHIDPDDVSRNLGGGA